MNLLFFNDFYPVMSYRRVQRESNESYVRRIFFGYSLWSAISCQHEWLKLHLEIDLLRNIHELRMVEVIIIEILSVIRDKIDVIK